MLSLGRFKRIIGLDIGTCLIKAVEARKVGGKLEITNFGTCPTPQGVISNGRVMDPPEVALAVKEALNAGGIRGREVCAATVSYTHLVLGARYYVGTDEGRYRWDSAVLKIPVIGSFAMKVIVVRFSETLSSLSLIHI